MSHLVSNEDEIHELEIEKAMSHKDSVCVSVCVCVNVPHWYVGEGACFRRFCLLHVLELVPH